MALLTRASGMRVDLPRQRRPALHSLARLPGARVGGAILVLLILFAAVGLVATPYDPLEIAPAEKLQPPSSRHLLGTDNLGRDLLSRLMAGARISLSSAVIVLAIAATLGVGLGLLAGYLGGSVDEVVMRVTDVVLAFPALVLALAIAATLGPGLINAMIAVALAWWPWYTRLVRAQVLSFRQQEFVLAAVSVGASPGRVIFRHILPNLAPLIIVQGSMDVGYAILATASLSFVGLGAQPPIPEWGAMIAQARSYLIDYWWYPAFPGMAIFLAVLGFNLLGDAVRDALDPRLRSRA